MKPLQKNIPALRFPEFDGEWEKNEFDLIAERSKDKYDPNKNANELPCIELESIEKNTGILLNTFSSKSQKSIKNSFKSNEVLFGKLRPNLKKYTLTSFDGVCSTEIWVLKGKKVVNEFLYYIIQTEKFNNAACITFGSKMPRADWSYISSNLFNIPTKPEQQKIASFLTAIDEKIAQIRQKQHLLEQYKKGMMQQLFSQQIRFTKTDGTAFEDWEENKLSHYLSVSKKKNLELKYSKQDVLSVSGNFGIVNQIEFQGRSFAGASVHNYGVVETGDIVYTKSPLKSNPYGIIKVNKGKSGIVSTLYAVYHVNMNTADGVFLDYYFQLDDNTNRYLRPLVRKGAKNDMKINNQYVLSDNIFIPSKEEQQKIATFLTNIDDKIAQVKEQLTAVEAYKKGLLQQLFV